MIPRSDGGSHGESADPASRVDEIALNRRRAIAMALGAGIGGVAASTVSAQPPESPPNFPKPATDIRSELKLVAPNVWAFIQQAAPGQSNFLISNCGMVAGADSLFGIDSTAAPVQANRFRAAAERATGKRFTRFALTHNHPDHTLGMQVFEGVEVIAQEQCREAMVKQRLTRPGFWDPSNPAWSDGTEQFHLVIPQVTYRDQLRLYDYGVDGVRLMWLGRAHTLGDTVAYLPAERVMFIGDIGFFGVTPLDNSGYAENWIKICDEILGMDVAVIVPGHGPVGGKAELADMQGYLKLLFTEGGKRFRKGQTPGRAAAEIDLGKYATWADSDRIVSNLTRMWDEFGGRLKPATSQADIQRARLEYDAIRGTHG